MLKKWIFVYLQSSVFGKTLLKKKRKEKKTENIMLDICGVSFWFVWVFFFSPPNLFCFGEIIFTFKKKIKILPAMLSTQFYF